MIMSGTISIAFAIASLPSEVWTMYSPDNLAFKKVTKSTLSSITKSVCFSDSEITFTSFKSMSISKLSVIRFAAVFRFSPLLIISEGCK
ncbi:hypothetical protein D3C85_1366120 [compost metagenome]